MLVGVAAHAPGIGGGIRLVHLVAVEAAAQAGMVVLLIRVTGGAGLGIERRLRVGAVAVAARLVRVGPDGGDVDAPDVWAAWDAWAGWNALRGRVAAHAVGGLDREVSAEPVAVLARGRWHLPERIGGVQRRADRRVTSLAQVGRWHREAAVAVTVTAGDAVLGDVGLVPRAVANVVPRERHVVRWRWVRIA